jgi:hypothetical protein
VLFPGAGSDRTHSSLVRIERRVRPAHVARVDFAYRKQGRRAPDRAPILEAEVRAAVRTRARRWNIPAGSVVVGGRSMGGRIASMVAAAETEPLPVAAVVLVSYPLHPPGRPEKARVAHLPRLGVPVLCVSGTRDAFGSPAELRRAFRRVPGPVTWHFVEGKGHDLSGADDEVADVVASWFVAL